ncbi:MAG: hypothetical protein IPL55_00145 [Saprospiraceae bacterium]|nr:hypothetical protein [Saprospiraceae bacterium]
MFIDITRKIAVEESKQKSKTENQEIQAEKVVSDIYNQKTFYKKIGFFEMMDSVVITQSTPGKSSQSSKEKIKNIDINLSLGAIPKNGILVELENGLKFRNKHFPVSLYRFDKNKKLTLQSMDLREIKTASIELGDAFDYTYKGRFTYPANSYITLSPDNKNDTVSATTSLKELLDVNIYSDLLALLGRKPNGIIQTEISTTFITNTQSWGKNDIVFNNYIHSYFKLAKFDSKFAQIDSSYFFGNTDSLKIRRLLLNRNAYLQAGLKTNLFKFGIGQNQQLFLNIGGEINLANADSLFQSDLVSVDYYPELVHTINNIENFGLEIGLKYLWQSVPKNSPFNNRETVRILNPSLTIYYFPFTNPNNKIYLRYAHFAQLNGDLKLNFPQFQFGFKTFYLQKLIWSRRQKLMSNGSCYNICKHLIIFFNMVLK